MDLRKQRLREVLSVLGDRKVIWFGTRGLDAAPVLSLGLLGLVYCQVAPLKDRMSSGDFAEDCLETISGTREDLNNYDIDSDTRIETVRFRQELMALQEAEDPDRGWLMIAYRPAEFLASVNYTKPKVKPAYLFHAAQRVFEHKPWVESQLKEIGLRTLDWRYLKDGETRTLKAILDKEGKLVLRASRSDGGAKLSVIASYSELRDKMPFHSDGFFAFAPYYEGALPLNLNACIYPNREIRVFPLSVQLIGISECTQLPFGFCGNDFKLASELDRSVMLEAELIAHRIGKWAADHGYIGQFGLDLLLIGGELRITEINPRFQASTYISEGIAEHLNISGPYLEHMAAFLGMSPPLSGGLPDLATQMRCMSELSGKCDLSQIILYNDRNTDVRIERLDGTKIGDRSRVVGLPETHILIRPHAMLGKIVSKESVTENGYVLREKYQGSRNAFFVNQVCDES